MRRRKLLVAVMGLAVVVAVGAVMFWPRPDRITQDTLNRIPLGMGRVEVEAILGGPPGDYRTVWTKTAEEHCNFGDVDDMAPQFDKYATLPRYQGDWVGNEGFIGVVFDDGFVEHRYFRRTVPETTTPIDNLLWRAKRQWRHWFPE